ncbi:MAG: hypothetical protein IJZ47_08405 [Oscillospiraceae bacterium]|nr:hypothetical protein [Oscillospiraceae bacterium]
MKIYCISEGELQLVENGKSERVECQRITNYLETLQRMKQRDEWKTTGKGAKFMQVEQKYYGDETAHGEPLLRSIGSYGDKLLYCTFTDGMGGMYRKDTESGDESYIFANKEYDLTGIATRNGKCVLTCAMGRYERHIGIVNMENGDVTQITEGFTSETHPFISRRDSSRILYTSMGYARNQSGAVAEKSPCSICCYDESTGSLDELIANDDFDYIKPSDDKEGNIYYIKRKYEPTKRESNLFMDILLFPVRIVRAIGGFLSVFSMAFGGEPLRTGGHNPAKSRTADERELFVEGNLIKAQKLSDNSDEGIIPSDWVLVKYSDGEETVLKKGVMDYHLTDDGDIIYSNGNAVRLLHKDGKDEKLCKLKLANSITVIE